MRGGEESDREGGEKTEKARSITITSSSTYHSLISVKLLLDVYREYV